jgi:1-aminocyclopropane-1-carboxylate deaminase
MNELFNPRVAINQHFKSFKNGEITIDVKREDLLHSEVSGNKLRKLKYNIWQAERENHDTILTYGGSFSNHIAATAAAGKIMGFKTIGIIRGDELGVDFEKTLRTNETLRLAHEQGIALKFIDRTSYREKESAGFNDNLKKEFGRFYNIPEGGTNALAVIGTSEILTDFDRENYNIIAVAAGTGGTAAGIVKSAASHQRVMVFSALKGDFLQREIAVLAGSEEFEFIDDAAFGGYARSTNALVDYMNISFRESGIPLDPIYTSKMLHGIEHLIESGVIKGKTRILAVHTGGLQSIAGYNRMLAKKRRSTISYEDQF